MKAWEKALVFLGLLLFLVSGYLYATRFPLRRYLFGIEDDGALVQVGDLAERQGSIRRLKATETEFQEITPSAPLYDYDVVVTGPESGATLRIDGGSTVVMEPNTMVKLDFLSVLGVDGMNRFSRVQVIVGGITAKAGDRQLIVRGRGDQIAKNGEQKVRIETGLPVPKPRPPVVVAAPSPSPTPTDAPESRAQARIVAPKRGTHLFAEKGSKQPLVKVALQWSMDPPDGKSRVTVWQPGAGGKREPLHQETIPARKGRALALFVAKKPGKYAWEITGPRGEAISKPEHVQGDFVVEREFEGIVPREHLIAGREITDNLLKGDLIKDFSGITLRWEKYPKAGKYQVWMGRSKDDPKALLERTVDEPQFSFNKNKVYAGQIYYKVSAELPSGFVATTGVQPFEFKFLAPILVQPGKDAVITQAEISREDNSLLFTWSKTNFTVGYELEIAQDPAFANPMVKKTLKENFFVLSNPAAGKYWWRVRGFTQGISSPMSQPNLLTIAP